MKISLTEKERCRVFDISPRNVNADAYLVKCKLELHLFSHSSSLTIDLVLTAIKTNSRLSKHSFAWSTWPEYAQEIGRQSHTSTSFFLSFVRQFVHKRFEVIYIRTNCNNHNNWRQKTYFMINNWDCGQSILPQIETNAGQQTNTNKTLCQQLHGIVLCKMHSIAEIHVRKFG